MSASNLLLLARQGDGDAIAALLNHALEHKQITAQVQLEQGVLQIWLRSPTVPHPSAAILIDRELARIHSPLIEWVQVEGQTAEAQTAWSEEFSPGLRSDVPRSTTHPTQTPRHRPIDRDATPDSTENPTRADGDRLAATHADPT